MKRALRRLAWVALGLAFVLGAVATRAFWDGRRALARGDAALAQGDAEGAVDEWRRAARWYAPGAGHVAAAYARLEKLAVEAEGKGDRTLALEAWRGIRSSALATRSFYTPYRDRLEEANARIASLMAAEEGGPEPAARKAFHFALLDRDTSPSLGWSIAALVGFLAWVGGGFWFAWRGLTAESKLDRRTAARAGVLIAAGLLLWLLGLHFA